MIDVKPLTGCIGAEVFDADVSDARQTDVLMDAFATHAVIVIRDRNITPEQQLAFAKRIGDINVNRFFTSVPGNPEIAMVLKEPDQERAIGERWHTDHSYDIAPAMCSMLHAIETPEIGGDTVFASMYASFDALSDGLKTTLRGLKAWHSSRHVFGSGRESSETSKTGRIGNSESAKQDALHPVVIRHPLSGREALYVNPEFTVGFDGWSPEESRALINYLAAHCTRAEFTCRVRWRPGTITIWDNRATWHKAVNDYPGQRRLMHRITIEGVALKGVQVAA